MKNIEFKLMLFTAVLWCCSSCISKDKDQAAPLAPLPEYTETGTGIVAYYVDNKAVIVKNTKQLFVNNASVYYPGFMNTNDTSFYMTSILDTDTGSLTFGIKTRNIIDTGKYILSSENTGKFAHAFFQISPPSGFDNIYKTNNTFIGQLYIKNLDTLNRIISGTFFARMKIYEFGSEYINITDGRFDVKYDAYK